jgi:hypothetical protein
MLWQLCIQCRAVYNLLTCCRCSSEQNLIQIVNYIYEALNDNMYCIGIFLDLKKAFDVCSQEILLKKLQKMGILGTITIGLLVIYQIEPSVLI